MEREPKTFEQAIDVVLGEMRATMLKKQHDYGPGNIADMGELGLLVRVNDKMARLKNLSLGKEQEKLDKIAEIVRKHDPDKHDAHSVMAKIMSTIDHDDSPANESIDDTWLDLANYGLIAQMVRRGIWGLPLEGK